MSAPAPAADLRSRFAAALLALREPVTAVRPRATGTDGAGHDGAGYDGAGYDGAGHDGAGHPDPYVYADELLGRWAEPQRRYHTTSHLLAVLDHIDTLAPYAYDPDLVRIAAWFHDAVYRPDRSENEDRSARLAERALAEAGLSEKQTDEVARLVRLTTTHDAAPADRDGAVLCDADLAILAAAPDAYRAYADAVREEYGFVPDDAFRAGRSAVLEQLLALPRLFRTPHGEREWEAIARANLTEELRALRDDPPRQ